MNKSRVLKLTNLTEINRLLDEGWCFEYTSGSGAQQVAVMRFYERRNDNILGQPTYVGQEVEAAIPVPLIARNLPD